MKNKSEGETYLDSFHGYVLEKHKGKWKKQHRLVMERKLGRRLRNKEVVHHINKNRADNRIENLQLMSPSSHATLHFTGVTPSKTTKEKMSKAAIRIASNPAERKRRSDRAKLQYQKGNLGHQTWKPGTIPNLPPPWNKGKHLSKALRKKLSEGQNRRWSDPEERRKQAERARIQMGKRRSAQSEQAKKQPRKGGRFCKS